MSDEKFDVRSLTGRKLSKIPIELREQEVLTAETLVALTNDPACDPRSGGIWLEKEQAQMVGLSSFYYWRELVETDPSLDFIRKISGQAWEAPLPVTNVSSLGAWKKQRDRKIYEEQLRRAGKAAEHLLKT